MIFGFIDVFGKGFVVKKNILGVFFVDLEIFIFMILEVKKYVDVVVV